MYLFPILDCEDPTLIGNTNYIPQYLAQRFGLYTGCDVGSRSEKRGVWIEYGLRSKSREMKREST